ncbi:MAG: SBBP repeat-containing protein [Thermodesulfobacteriota bacterium]|nr:SBBP repeat-containing protein [Thermodesulfobacteriota bacterium]
MTRLCAFFLLIFSLSINNFTSFAYGIDNPENPEIKKIALIQASHKKLPFLIIKNNGQLNINIAYYIKGGKYEIYFNRDKIIYHMLKTHPHEKKYAGLFRDKKDRPSTHTTFTLKPLDTSNETMLISGERLPGSINYLIGKNPENWHTDIPAFKEIIYKNLYRGIDLKIYGTNNQMEYDFIVSPHADPSKIHIACDGIDTLRINKAGDLIINTSLGEIRHLKPLIYQNIRGKKHIIDGAFKLSKNTFSFDIIKYNTHYPLIIDPLTLSYSTYLGGSAEDLGQSIAVDSSGNAYITGVTKSENFPTSDPYQATLPGNYSVFVTKINPTGDSLIYSTYIGGSSDDRASGIAVDSTGSAYITGETKSENFPTKNPYQATLAGEFDAFVTKLTPSGNDLSFSTYLGGTLYDTGSSVAVDSSGGAFVGGSTRSIDFPVKNAFQENIKKHFGIAILTDVFVAKLSPDGSSLTYSTYLGGRGQDKGNSIAVDQSGNVYITGETSSVDFPVINGLQEKYAGHTDAFVSKLNFDGKSLAYSTYVGGSLGDYSRSITVDSFGSVYITGETGSLNFPVVNAYQDKIGGPVQGILYFGDAFAAKISPDGNSLIYSTYLGGRGQDGGNSIAVDQSGNVYITGETSSVDFPVINGLQETFKGHTDAFVVMLNPDGKCIAYSTYIGGNGQDRGNSIVVDRYGFSYITGFTYSDNFPLENSFIETKSGQLDIFITKIKPMESPFLPDGDVAPFGERDGIVDVGDALVCLQFALGLKVPSEEDLRRGDVSPLNVHNIPQPDGLITVGDSLVILRKAIGTISF